MVGHAQHVPTRPRVYNGVRQWPGGYRALTRTRLPSAKRELIPGGQGMPRLGCGDGFPQLPHPEHALLDQQVGDRAIQRSK